LREKLALLPNVIAMTEALAYAHERRVVHRDLKPSNVLIGAFGETVVIDWGLAKERGAAGEPEGKLGISSSGEHWHTREGSFVGTVGYMSPEQALGDPVDERADVYALGAVLYHLFAGHAPHHSPTVRETLDKVILGPPEPLAQLVPDLAPDLVAIVEKAMARAPADRYGDARAMAEDLKRFQAGKLVGAHVYSLRTLLGRWLARHRAVVLTASALLVALAVTLTVSVRRVVRERDRADAAKVEAEKARAVAITQRDAAEKLVDFIVQNLQSKLVAVGRIDILVGLGDEIDRYYQAASETSPDAAVLVRRSRALAMIATVADFKLDTAYASRFFDHAIALCERALVLAPTDEPAILMLSKLHVNLAGTLIDLNRLDAAEEHAKAGIVAGERATAAHPESPRAASELASAMLRLALVQRQKGRLDLTPPLYMEACELVDRALAAAPENTKILHQLGWAYFERGEAALDRGDVDEAVTSLTRSVEARETCYASDPTPENLSDLAVAQVRAANARARRGELDAAMAAGTSAAARLEEAAAQDPGDLFLARNLAVTLVYLAADEDVLARCESGIEHARRAVTILERAAHDDANIESRRDLVGALAELGNAQLCAGHARAARDPLARGFAQEGAAPDPQSPTPIAATVGPNLALAALADGDAARALSTARTAVSRAAAHLASSPGDPAAAFAEGVAELALGDVLASRKDAVAVAAYRAAHDAFSRRMAGYHDPLLDPVWRAGAALKLARLVSADEARLLVDEATLSLEALDGAHRLVPRGVSLLKEARALRAKAP
jgi:tetratricopeptide (TPR) repeat protein